MKTLPASFLQAKDKLPDSYRNNRIGFSLAFLVLVYGFLNRFLKSHVQAT